MPKFLDKHVLRNLDEKSLKDLQNSPEDEFGVKHINILYNISEDKGFCHLDAPNKEAVEKHHDKYGYKCDFIIEVESTA